MNRNFLISSILFTFLMTAGMASANVYSQVVPVRHHYGYYYDYGYGYPYYAREWVPGHWATVRRHHHFARVWVPGHWVGERWEYRY